MSNYIYCEMRPTNSGIGGTFEVLSSFKLDNIPSPFNDVIVKIDTGCSISTIPLAGFRVLRFFCERLKRDDIRKGIPYQLSYGVESAGMKHKKPVTDQDKLDCTAMKFRHAIVDFTIADVPIEQEAVYVNYDRRGNILIGMDILSKWDVHMGISKNNGKNVFLGCPVTSVTQEYYNALQKHFGL